MPAIVNLLFNTVLTNTTISFTLVLPLVSGLSLLAGLGGHLLLWLVLVGNPRRRCRPSSVLLLNLSLADLGALLTLPCVLLSAASQGWRLGGRTCVLLGFMTSLTAGADVFSLAALAVLRYRIVVQPARTPTSTTHVAITVVVIWLVSVAMALPKVTYIQFDTGCTWSVDRGEWLGFLVPAFLFYYVAPLLCITIHCGFIISHLHCSRGTPAADRRNRKAAALLIGSTLVFAVSWLPYYALEFVNVVSPYVSSAASPVYPAPAPTPADGDAETKVSLLWEVAALSAILLVCLAPCWNPPLYFLLSRPAVRELRAMLPSSARRCLGRKPVRRWRIAPVPPLHPPPPPPQPQNAESQ